MLPTNPIRWLTVLVGLGSIAAGVDYLLDGGRDKTGQALVILFPFGIAMIVLALAGPSDPSSVEGVDVGEGGTTFDPVPARRFTSVVGLAGFMCVGLGMVLFPGQADNAADVRGIGAVFTLVFAGLIAVSLRGIRRGHMRVVLTPDRILQRNRLREQQVRWDDIETVGTRQWRGTRWTTLKPDLWVPHQFMAADPAVFHALVEHMHATPADRPLLADPGGVEALRRVGLGPAHAGGREQPEQGDAAGHDPEQRQH